MTSDVSRRIPLTAADLLPSLPPLLCLRDRSGVCRVFAADSDTPSPLTLVWQWLTSEPPACVAPCCVVVTADTCWSELPDMPDNIMPLVVRCGTDPADGSGDPLLLLWLAFVPAARVRAPQTPSAGTDR